MSANDDGVSECKYRKLEQTDNRGATFILNSNIQRITDSFSQAWASRKDFSDEVSKILLSQTPFCHCVIPDFVEDTKILQNLKDELLDLEFRKKDNDLYKFHQSAEDLKTAKSPCIAAFRRMLSTEMHAWLSKTTGIELNDTVDTFCAQYAHTDTLLCHDDELEGRRIAYIYYLVNNWTKEDGGTLDLYSVDDNIQPKEIVKSILPARNNFVFFEVSPGSYHQVAEVLGEDRTRLSISGWFHGPPIERPPPYIEKPRPLIKYGDIDDETFFDWVNPVYLNPGAQGSIQEKFENDSEIELQDFLQKEKYELLLQSLKSADINWEQIGPPNKRCYRKADASKLPEPVETCVKLFQSDAMFLLLSNMTGLRLHELAAASSDAESESEGDEGEPSTSNGSEGKNRKKKNNEAEDKPCTSRCRTEVRHWTHKSYTLAHDTDTEGTEFALDLVFYVGCSEWKMDYGGFTVYIAKDEDEELLTVTPAENSVALVYRDKESQRFVKYLNSDVNKMPDMGFYDINVVYYE